MSNDLLTKCIFCHKNVFDHDKEEARCCLEEISLRVGG